jgi:hypothetical protein
LDPLIKSPRRRRVAARRLYVAHDVHDCDVSGKRTDSFKFYCAMAGGVRKVQGA